MARKTLTPTLPLNERYPDLDTRDPLPDGKEVPHIKEGDVVGLAEAMLKVRDRGFKYAAAKKGMMPAMECVITAFYGGVSEYIMSEMIAQYCDEGKKTIN